jgi:hypothetical protein
MRLLSQTSKMPCPSFSLPARKACPIGGKLARLEGTPCSGCYAARGFYTMRNVRDVQSTRFAYVKRLLRTNPKRLEGELVDAIGPLPYFRWFDSGDLFSREFAELVCRVTERTPNTRHWIPTQERRLAASIRWPSNVTVRVSGVKVDAVSHSATLGSMVYTDRANLPAGAHVCPAPRQDGECKACRACWNPKVKLTAYSKH